MFKRYAIYFVQHNSEKVHMVGSAIKELNYPGKLKLNSIFNILPGEVILLVSSAVSEHMMG